jgi:hypothetical protein
MRSSDEEPCLPTLTLTPIGIIRSMHRDVARTPIQPVCAVGSAGRVEVFEAYAEGWPASRDFRTSTCCTGYIAPRPLR